MAKTFVVYKADTESKPKEIMPSAYLLVDNKFYGPFSSVDRALRYYPSYNFTIFGWNDFKCSGEPINDQNPLNLLKTNINRPFLQFEECELNLFEYYPKIWRGFPDCELHPSIEESGFYVSFSQSITLLENLIDEIKEVFKFIEPDYRNLKCFSSKIRSVLILAATEVEAQCRGILKGNNYNNEKEEYWNTKDYIKLLPALKLNEYKFKFWRYQSIGEFSPFKNWSKTATTRTLFWYDAYNKVKHDREANFELASLENAINAICACIAMLIGQYGPYLINDILDNFSEYHIPTWKPNQIYYFADNRLYGEQGVDLPEEWKTWKPVNYSF